MLIDLHIHSDKSLDGEFSAEEIVEKRPPEGHIGNRSDRP